MQGKETGLGMKSAQGPKLLYVVAIAAALFPIGACDKFDGSKEKKAQENHDNYVITAANGQTFYLDRVHGGVRIYNNGDFVEVPLVGPQPKDSDLGVKLLQSTAQDLDITGRLKFHDGKLLYFIEVSPRETPEYIAYQLAVFARNYAKENPNQSGANPTDAHSAGEGKQKDVSPKQETPLVEPQNKYINTEWEKYWDQSANFLTELVEDDDAFPVTTIDVPLSGSINIQRTRIVDDKGRTTAFQYYGEQPFSLSEFQRIKKMDSHWRLDVAKK